MSEDDEYGDLIEESLKEFSLSLTKDQLQMFNTMNEDAAKKALAQQEESKEPSDDKNAAKKQNKVVFKLPPILSVPKFASRFELTSFLNSEQMKHYRPQAKVVRVVESGNMDAVHEGTMFRKRMSKKKNKYKQVVKSNNKHLPPLFMLDN